MNVLLFLTDGFEEIEALASIDILRRGKVNVKSVSLTNKKEITASHGVVVQADILFKDADFNQADMLIIPGGTTKFNEYPELKEKLIEANTKSKKIAAICAAPMVLGEAGLLKNKKAVCYPGFEKYLVDAEIQSSEVVIDDNIITAKGPAFAINFALTLLEIAAGTDVRNEVEKALLLK